MDIMGLIVSLVSGGIGGNLSGAALKDKSLGAIGNTIAGAVGGAAGGYILQAVDLLNSMGLGSMDIATLGTQAGITAVCGAVVTAIIGYVKAKMGK